MITIEELRSKLNNREVGVIGKHKFFAVCVPVIETDKGLELLFEVRSPELDVQPGDICFPGGMIEEGETPVIAALREMEEEIGIKPETVEVISEFDTMYGFSGYTLYPFIVKLPSNYEEQISLNWDEVSEIFTVPLDFFKETIPENYDMDVVSDTSKFPYEETGVSKDYKWRKGRNTIPLYRYETRVIWGLTARILKQMGEHLL